MRVQGMETTAASMGTWWRRGRILAGVAILGGIVVRLGAGPFVDGIRAIDAAGILLATLLTALTTVCAAWRWQVVAQHIGIALRLRPAVAAYYQSQFLNLTLPGGVVGDLDRGVRHGRDVGTVRGGLGAVAVERLAGQGVLVTAAVVIGALAGGLPA
uniref:lysylphosphatidylglycerol synthase domain-containing protein n=1 Tax=Kribbia dieselivorans TaxID=331526 RepID=UPI00157AFC7C